MHSLAAMSVPMPPMPQPDAAQRLQQAITRRDETDYVFDFWTALGWTILTCGLYSFYVVYRLFWRSVEHNRRRLEVLDAANALAWERATTAGRAEELTPRFQAVAAHLAELRAVAGEFRDPVIWTLIVAVTGGIGQVAGYVLLDMDLVRHEAAERAAEAELAAIYSALGASMSAPATHGTKPRHAYVNRVIALLLTCGLYGLWWLYDVMVEANRNHQRDWEHEDALWVAAGTLAGR